MDCGSSLNDSFELKSIERQLHSAILLEPSPFLGYPITTTRHHFRRHNTSTTPPKNPQNFLARFTNFFDPFSAPKQVKAGSQDPFFAIFDGSGPLLTIPEVLESGSGILLEFKSMAAAAVIRKLAFEQFTATTSNATIAAKPSSNEANILALVSSQPSPTPIAPPLEDSAGKENHESLSQPQSKKTKKARIKAKQQKNQSFEKELQEMHEKFQHLRIEKEQIEELLKVREETLKMKEEELETSGKE